MAHTFKVGDKVIVKQEVLNDLEYITGIGTDFKHSVEGEMTVHSIEGKATILCENVGWSFNSDWLEHRKDRKDIAQRLYESYDFGWEECVDIVDLVLDFSEVSNELSYYKDDEYERRIEEQQDAGVYG